MCYLFDFCRVGLGRRTYGQAVAPYAPQSLGSAKQMHSELYWIDTTSTLKLAIMARPRAGDWLEDEVAHWKRSGVGIVISLLERDEVDELGLAMEATLCGQNDIEFLSFPIPDRGLPKDADVAMSFAAYVASKSIPIAIHCRAGIGRSSVMAAAVLIAKGTTPATALSAIEKARGLPIPDTDAQRDWVMKLRNRAGPVS
jgi:protein-tyrosine phosphatase